MSQQTRPTASKMLCSQKCSHGNFRQKDNDIKYISYNYQKREIAFIVYLMSHLLV